MSNKLLTMSDYYYLDSRLEDHTYQSFDDRVLESYVEDIDGGSNFADFCKEFFLLLDKEDYWQDN